MTDYRRGASQSLSDEENAPLIRHPEEEGPSDRSFANPTFADRVNDVAQEPLTPLSKILLILALVLLLISSIFIGLFAGAQHKLNVGHGGGSEPGHEPPSTVPTATSTITSTITSTATSTITATTTAIPVPLPVPTTPPEEKCCLEPHCIALSASVLSSLDLTKDPCNNFYDFANGGWLRTHPLPADKGRFGNFDVLAQQNKLVIREILEKPVTSSLTTSADEEILGKLRDHYSACLDEDRLNQLGTEPLLDIIKTTQKLYREEDTDIGSTTDRSLSSLQRFNGLTAATAFLHSRGIGAFFSFLIDGDVGVDPNFMVLWFNQPELGLSSKEYYEEKTIKKIYQNVLENLLLAVLDDEDGDQQPITESILHESNDAHIWPPWPWPPWGGDDDDSSPDKPENRTFRAHRLAKQVVNFEHRLAQASLDLDLLQDPIATYNPVPLDNLTIALPEFDFPTYFSTFTPRSFPDRIILTYPSYATSLSGILNSTSSDVVEAYLVTRAALSLSPYLGMETDAWKAQRILVEALTGVRKGAVGDRAEYCVGQVETSLGFAAGRYFVQETFSGDSKERATKVMTDIVAAFKESLSHIKWMDEKSANAAAEKADAIRIKVGYPMSPNTTDPRSIASYYSIVKIKKDSFIENTLSAAMNDNYKKWTQLGKQRDPESWEMYPSTVNAYFNTPANEIVFPAGILQPPLFYRDWPGYVAYGAFGHVASHELTHAFDSVGRFYNQQGKLQEWWTNSTNEGFKSIEDCIVKQYSEYTIDDGKGGKIHVDGNLTSQENIGDTGLIQAYRAWKAQYQVSAEGGGEYLLPGLDFTREQMFFISFARMWAMRTTPLAAVQRIRTDTHSPSRYRIDGTVYNIPEFAKAFKCSKSAKLNPPPDKRCLFWS